MYEKTAKELALKKGGITCCTVRTCQWVGSPSTPSGWREWRWTPPILSRPDPNSSAWAPAAEIRRRPIFTPDAGKLRQRYPQRGVYFDCMQWIGCHNEAHVADTWTPTACGNHQQILSSRQVLRAASTTSVRSRPQYAASAIMIGTNWPTARRHDNWIAKADRPDHGHAREKLYRVSPCRSPLLVPKGNNGATSQLADRLACSGTDKENARLVRQNGHATQDGQHGEWTLPRWKDTNTSQTTASRCSTTWWTSAVTTSSLPTGVVSEISAAYALDEHVRFLGYWELASTRG